MKPIELRLKNIGPYLDETIDFTKLDNIFLIAGNTGAGKTFIFDAMTYAIYGKLMGNRAGHSKDLRSRYAEKNIQKCFVEFTFQVGKNIYKIQRSVPIERPDHKTPIYPNPVLQVKPEGKNIFVACTPDNNIATVNNKLQEIIGLTADEFSKVILLPQGAFAEFLKQNSGERQATLEKLFPVADYKLIMNSVAERVKNVEEEMKKSSAVIDTEKKYLKSQNIDYDNAKTIINDSENTIKVLKEEQTSLSEKAEELSSIKAKLERSLKDAQKKETNLLLKENLIKQEKEIKELDEANKKGEKANELKEVINSEKRCLNTKKSAEEELKASEEKLKKSVEKFNELENQRPQMEELKAQNEKDKTEIDRLSDKIKKAEDYNKSVEAEKESLEKLNDLKEELKKLDEEITAIKEPLAGKDAEVLIDELSKKIIEQTEKKKDLEQKKLQAKDRDAEQKKLSSIEKEITAEQKKTDEAEKKVKQAENSLNTKKEELENQKIQNSAWNIARILKPGVACPVCGSMEHPKPAENHGDVLSLEDEVKVFEKALKDFQEDFNKKNTTLTSKKAAEKERKEILEKYKNLEPTEEIDSKYETEKAVLNELNARKEEISSVQSELKNKNAEREIVNKNLSSAQTEYETAKAKRETLQQDTGSDFEALKASYKKLSDAYNLNVKKFSDWDSELHSAEKEKTGAEAAKNEKEKFSKNAAADYKAALDNMNKKLAASIFKTTEEALKCMIPQEILEENRKKHEEYYTNLSAVTEALKNTEDIKPSAQIEEEIKLNDGNISDNKIKISENQNKLSNAQKSQALLKNSYQKIKEENKKVKEMEKKMLPLIKLNEHLRGGSANIPFDIWALGLFFEQVVDYASDRFFNISNHRFEFKFRDAGDKRGNAKMGLDLQVIDHNSPDGKPYDTETLSGGETFEASISLALAITDVVQNNNGGISLDSLFIDEGFGTLDPEPLESTMKVLNELSERKMIGIISHVDSLQDDESGISSQIIVDKTDHGSTLRIK